LTEIVDDGIDRLVGALRGGVLRDPLHAGESKELPPPSPFADGKRAEEGGSQILVGGDGRRPFASSLIGAAAAKLIRLDLGDQPAALAYLNQLPLVRTATPVATPKP